MYIYGPVSRVPTPPPPPWDGGGMMPLWWCIYIHTYLHTYLPTYIPTYIHTYIPLHYLTLHYLTLHYLTLHYLTLHSIHTYIHTSMHACMHIYIPTYQHTNIPPPQATGGGTRRTIPPPQATGAGGTRGTIPPPQATGGGDQKNHTTTTGHRGGDQKNQTILSTHTHWWGGKGGGQRCTIYIYILNIYWIVMVLNRNAWEHDIWYEIIILEVMWQIWSVYDLVGLVQGRTNPVETLMFTVEHGSFIKLSFGLIDLAGSLYTACVDIYIYYIMIFPYIVNLLQ